MLVRRRTRLSLRSFLPFLGGMALGLLPREAIAEGSAEWGTNQPLQSDTVMYVDIVDPSAEQIAWTGSGTLTVYDPSGATVATLNSGDQSSVAVAGAYSLVLSRDQSSGSAWSVEVLGQTDPGFGRLWSYN